MPNQTKRTVALICSALVICLIAGALFLYTRNVAMGVVEEVREVSKRDPVAVNSNVYTDDDDPMRCFIPFYSTTNYFTERPREIELRSWWILGFTGAVETESVIGIIRDNGTADQFNLDVIIDIELIDGEWKIVKTTAIT